MQFIGESLDDVLMHLYAALTTQGNGNSSTRGDSREFLGVTLRLLNPRARLSLSEDRGKPFSALGELLWYLSKENKLSFIRRYIPMYKKESEADGTVYGGYGPRLFSMRGNNQVSNIINLLRESPGSRRAVIQLFNAEDISSRRKEVPCTTTMQFFQRDRRLHMATTLRSNDAYLGLPHDIFCFTMLQEMIARSLGVEIGEYYQFVGSMHIYNQDLESCQAYVKEGFHKLSPMPEMPEGDPFPKVRTLLDSEKRLRKKEFTNASEIFSESYWQDILRLLQIYFLSENRELSEVVVGQFTSKVYKIYAEDRLLRAKKAAPVDSGESMARGRSECGLRGNGKD